VRRNLPDVLAFRPHGVTGRGTYARWNLAEGIRYLDIIKEGLSLGFSNVWIDTMSEKDMYGSVLPEDLGRVREMYDEVAAYFVEHVRQGDYIDFSNITRYVSSTRVIRSKRVSWGCGAGRGFACVTPEGDVYVCHRFTGMDDFRLGDVFNGTSKELTHRIIAHTNVDQMVGCRDCWMRYICGGGCLKINYEGSGSMFEPYQDVYCEIRRHELELGMYLNCVLGQEELAILERIYDQSTMQHLD
jgi:uncharacterized protein